MPLFFPSGYELVGRAVFVLSSSEICRRVARAEEKINQEGPLNAPGFSFETVLLFIGLAWGMGPRTLPCHSILLQNG